MTSSIDELRPDARLIALHAAKDLGESFGALNDLSQVRIVDQRAHRRRSPRASSGRC